MIKQVSVFLENKEGRLGRVLMLLGEKKINIRALSIAETNAYGILRLIVTKPAEAVEVLKSGGIRVSETDVLAIEVPDTPGGLAVSLEPLAGKGINIEYMYAFLARRSDQAVVIFKVEEMAKAVTVLEEAGIKVLEGATLYSL
ncbi:MAG: amino acid-binding protein [Peptococcaceae bacterium]